MKIRQLHPWNVTFREAIKIQKELRSQVILKNLPGEINHIAGTDVAFSKKTNTAWACVVVLSFPELKKTDEACIKGRTNFTYVPGLLSFREIPFILEALKKLRTEPDLIFCDGQGIAHPRGLGLASHLGILIEKPTIGCAKTRLVGEFSAVGLKRGDYSYLLYKGRKVGAVVRTRSDVKPLFISPGYAVSMDDAVRLILKCGGRYRIPEPTRQAHLLCKRLQVQGSTFRVRDKDKN
jgi:deoxyribonuclease V